MVEQISLVNELINDSVIMNKNDSYYLLDVIDWGYVSSSQKTSKYPDQIGNTVNVITVDTRIISIICWIVSEVSQSGKTYEQYWNESNLDIATKKRRLAKILNPSQKLKVLVGEYYLEGYSQGSIKYGTSEDKNNEVMCQCKIDMICNNSMFNKANSNIQVLVGSIPKFKFPLVIPKPDGMIFGIKNASSLVVAKNDGDIKTGAIFTIKAMSGILTNPKIFNPYTGEEMTINKTLAKGEMVVICTVVGEIKITGITNLGEENYFRYWMFDNDYIQLDCGQNVLGYSADNDTHLAGNFGLTVEIQERYFTIGEE
jgi:hypothetical protein